MIETRYLKVISVVDTHTVDFDEVVVELAAPSGASTAKITYVLARGDAVPIVGDQYVVSIRPHP